MKCFFQKIKNRSRYYYFSTWNSISSGNTVTEFSKIFPGFYKWPDLTDVQVVLTAGTVGLLDESDGWLQQLTSI
jgi:hypothetical protein